MRKRLRILLIVLIALITIVAFGSGWHFWLLGTIRGEPFYAGWPTCYWSHETYAYLTDDSTPRPAVLSGKPETTAVLLDLAKDRDGLVRVEAVDRLLYANPDDEEILHEAISSLIGALGASSIQGRCRAAARLALIGPRARDAIPALIRAGNEGPDGVYFATSGALQSIGPDSNIKE